MTNRLSIAFGVLVAVLVAALGTFAVTPSPVAAQTATATSTATATPTGTPGPAISGTLPRNGGTGLGVWTGGRVEDVPGASAALGCRLLALWLINNGEFVGFVYGAPDAVNATFRATYPSLVPAGAVIVVCGAGSAPAIAATATPTPIPSTAAGVKESMLIVGFIFQRHFELPVGSNITWRNIDGVQHTVTADDGNFDSGSITPGRDFSFTFTKPGTFAYRCTIHTFMRESVVIR